MKLTTSLTPVSKLIHASAVTLHLVQPAAFVDQEQRRLDLKANSPNLFAENKQHKFIGNISSSTPFSKTSADSTTSTAGNVKNVPHI